MANGDCDLGRQHSTKIDIRGVNSAYYSSAAKVVCCIIYAFLRTVLKLVEKLETVVMWQTKGFWVVLFLSILSTKCHTSGYGCNLYRRLKLNIAGVKVKGLRKFGELI